MTGEFPEDSDKRFSCEYLVTEKTPPTFLWHTASDQAVPVENSLLYAMELRKNQVPFEMHIYPEGPHGMATADGMTCKEDVIDTNAKRAVEWTDNVKKWLEMIW